MCGDLYSRSALRDVLLLLLRGGAGGKGAPLCLLAHERREGDGFDDFAAQLLAAGP